MLSFLLRQLLPIFRWVAPPRKSTDLPNSTFFNPFKTVGSKRLMVVESSLKEKGMTALIAAALTTSIVVPNVAEAASGVTPSLNNFLLNIGAGGVVLVAILGAISGVSNFDLVKRG